MRKLLFLCTLKLGFVAFMSDDKVVWMWWISLYRCFMSIQISESDVGHNRRCRGGLAKRPTELMMSKVYPAVKTPRPGNECPVYQKLWDASELIMHPPKPLSMRDAGDGVRLYSSGPNFQRAMVELQKGSNKLAATFIEYDINEGQPNPKSVDPQSIKMTDQGIAYHFMPEPPKVPKTVDEAMKFFSDHGGWSGLARRPDEYAIRAGVLAAVE